MGNTTKRLLSIGICDDDELILTTMRTICQHYLSEIKLDMCLHTYNSCKALLASSEIRTMDILFLDIEIDTLHSGIDVKNFMQLRHSNCLIVFITSHNELIWKKCLWFYTKTYWQAGSNEKAGRTHKNHHSRWPDFIH